jgi:hypothetical protein
MKISPGKSYMKIFSRGQWPRGNDFPGVNDPAETTKKDDAKFPRGQWPGWNGFRVVMTTLKRFPRGQGPAETVSGGSAETDFRDFRCDFLG